MRRRKKKSITRRRRRSPAKTRTRTLVKYRTRTRRAAPARRRRRSSGAGGSVKLSMAGIKKILTSKAVIGAAVGAIGARAVYGLVKSQAPDLDAKLTAALATAITLAVGILAVKKVNLAGPIAVGAVAALVLDLLGPEIASAISDSWPAGAEAIGVGMGSEPSSPILVPAPAPGDVALTGLGAGMPDAYGVGERLGLPDAYGASGGLGQLDMISLMPGMS